MTDRELLEAAARAAGMQWDSAMEAWYEPPAKYHDGWNPLTDDGDALRLAVKLRLSPEYDCDEVYVSAGPDFTAVEQVNGDRLAATRRCIVRAAASIGTLDSGEGRE
jgi:hypothetical protein